MLKTALSYLERSNQCRNPLGKRLFALMEEKQTNLCVAADVATTRELIELAHVLGPSICVFKTHIDIVDDFTPETVRLLQQAAEQHNFLLFEDRKFADIGNTVLHQYRGGFIKSALGRRSRMPIRC